MTHAPKKPEPESGKKEKQKDIDRDVEQSFPASDPPSYSGGTVGAPPRSEKDSK